MAASAASKTAYDTQGNAYLFTNYDDAASSGSIVNQVQRTFNGLGQLTAEYQANGGAVNTSTTAESAVRLQRDGQFPPTTRG